ncbi:GNAT family N-acetyltransferase [Vibrio coralliilyticus]|uniref:GNAT family N-acetyltransferase n=1 Tax=Vibrio coralliilyticus TaxID=190893 RepID=A0AAP6ZMZ2_9VIBR|nr:GNAT family N-acetyltransferase [Vibrio coralliilyticus]NOJ24252.1 GNAT family N-acetyltransferase [Vibrio coralliilyticus]
MNSCESKVYSFSSDTTVTQQTSANCEAQYVIRAAQVEQLDVLNELLCALHEEHHSKSPCTFKSGKDAVKAKDIAYYLVEPNHFVYAAIHSNQIVGFITGRVYILKSAALQSNCVGNIDEIYTLPKFRRLGIAQALVRRLETSFLQHGATHAYLDVWAQNKPALSFYAMQSFTSHTYSLKKVLVDQP